MTDSCCIVELKETIQKLNVELSQSRDKISELDAKVREQEEENTRLTRNLKECEEKCRATQKRLKFAEQKLAQFSHKPQTAAQIRLNLINDGSLSCSDRSDPDEDRRNPISDSSSSCSDGPDSDDSPTHVRHPQIRRNLINDGSSSCSDGSDSDEDRRNPISDSSSSCSDGPDSDDSPTHVRHPQIRRNLINDGSSSCTDGSDSDEDRRNPLSDSSSSCSNGPDSDDSPTHVRHPQIRRNLINDGSSSCSDGSDSDEDRRNPISDSSSSCSDGPDSDDSPTHVRHPQVNETNDDALYINSLPNEIILKIFSYLTQNQLGQIARVCKRWNVLTKSPVLWRKVNVKIFSSDTEKNAVTKSFITGLPSCVTFIRLDFSEWGDLIAVDFEELCVKLHQNCPYVEELILTHCSITNILPEVINFCTQFLLCVKKLVFHKCYFPKRSRTVELNDNSKIEVLDLYCCYFSPFSKTQFSKLLYLKELRLYSSSVYDTWFEDDASFLNQLDVLDLAWTFITASTFLAIQGHGHNLKELYLCEANLLENDLSFNNSVFPHLRTICLSCYHITCEGVVSLIHSCPSLENVYVDEHVAESFAAHPFVLANRCKSDVVKAIDWNHNNKVDYL